MKVEIKKDSGWNGLWIIFGDNKDGTSLAVTEEEIEPLRDACEVWLEKRSQEILKESLSEDLAC